MKKRRAAKRTGTKPAKAGAAIGVTVNAYAVSRGVGRKSIVGLIARGVIPALPSGRVDPEAADRAWADNGGAQGGHAATREERAAGPVAKGSTTYAEARRYREIARAALTRLDLEERQGRLLPVERVIAEQSRALRTVRDRVLALPDRIAAGLAATADLGETRRILEAALRGALGEAADATERTDP